VPAASSKEYAREKNSIGFSFSSNLKMEMISFFAQRKRGKMGEGGGNLLNPLVATTNADKSWTSSQIAFLKTKSKNKSFPYFF
jgi:hypothetical protein